MDKETYIQRFQQLCKKRYGVQLTPAQAEIPAMKLANFIVVARRHRARKQKLHHD